MKPEQMDMLINFVLREKRYLRKRETSFTEKELREGEELLRKAVKAVVARKMSDQELGDAQTKPAKTKKLQKEIVKKCKGIGKKQLFVVLQNFDLFNNVIEKKQKEQKIIIESLNGDKFYNPRKRVYA